VEKIIHLSQLDGYDSDLESARKKKFREFITSNNPEKKRKVMQSLANLTSLRSATFVAAYEEALGLHS